MKYLLFFLVLSANFIWSQSRVLDSLKIAVKTSTTVQKIDTTSYSPISTAFIESTPTIPIDIKANNWSETLFTPYKESLLTFPFEIEFSDTIFASPIAKPKLITSRYGWRGGKAHSGIDIDLETGDSVFAILDGVVRFSNNNSGYGNTVVVRHFNGLETAYTHLSELHVKPNDTVAKGTMIAKGGNTGRSSGSHLHLITSYKGHNINPEYLFDFSENNKIRAQTLWVTKHWTQTAYHSSNKQSKLKLLTSKTDALASLVKAKKIYIVKSGDTLSTIANRNNISLAALCKSNGVSKTSLLKIGQKLVL